MPGTRRPPEGRTLEEVPGDLGLSRSMARGNGIRGSKVAGPEHLFRHEVDEGRLRQRSARAGHASATPPRTAPLPQGAHKEKER